MSWNTGTGKALTGEIRAWNTHDVVPTPFSGAGLILLGIACGALIGWLIAKVFYLQQRSWDRKQSVQQSKSVTLGYVSEKIAPLLPNFPYDYKDLVFLGKWVDYLCFDGLSTWVLKQIVFIEIKTWKSQLNKNEISIKAAIDAKKVKRETVRL